MARVSTKLILKDQLEVQAIDYGVQLPLPDSCQTGGHYPPDLPVHAADIHPKSQQLPAHAVGFASFTFTHPRALYQKQSLSRQQQGIGSNPTPATSFRNVKCSRYVNLLREHFLFTLAEYPRLSSRLTLRFPFFVAPACSQAPGTPFLPATYRGTRG